MECKTFTNIRYPLSCFTKSSHSYMITKISFTGLVFNWVVNYYIDKHKRDNWSKMAHMNVHPHYSSKKALSTTTADPKWPQI